MFAPLFGVSERTRANAPLRWLAAAWLDLSVKPVLSLSVGAASVIIAAAITGLLEWSGLGFFILPFTTAYSLLVLFLALPLMEVSRRLDRNLGLGARAIFGVWKRHVSQLTLLLSMAVLAFWIWHQLVYLLISSFVGIIPDGLIPSVSYVLLAMPGWALLLLLATGLGMGFGCLVLFICTLPALIDSDSKDSSMCMRKGLRILSANQMAALVWAAIVGFGLVFATVTVLGLVVMVPVIGHAMWHAYADMGRFSPLKK